MKLDHLVVMASDLEASAAHYDKLLPVFGFERTRRWVWYDADAGLAFDLRQAEEGPGYRRRGPGLNHFAFAASSEEELETWAAGLREAGLDVPAVQHFGPARAYFIPDPDGLRVELIWDPET